MNVIPHYDGIDTSAQTKEKMVAMAIAYSLNTQHEFDGDLNLSFVNHHHATVIKFLGELNEIRVCDIKNIIELTQNYYVYRVMRWTNPVALAVPIDDDIVSAFNSHEHRVLFDSLIKSIRGYFGSPEYDFNNRYDMLDRLQRV